MVLYQSNLQRKPNKTSKGGVSAAPTEQSWDFMACGPIAERALNFEKKVAKPQGGSAK